MTRTSTFQFVLIIAICTTVKMSEAGNAKRPPNVLFILADDLGWRDLSVEGSSFYESPNIDRIANAGMRFTQGYATCQVCSPSRASIMLGQFPARHGITDWIGAAEGLKWKRNTRLLPAKYVHSLPEKDLTMAEAFRKAGYRTFFAGKWHLGDKGSFPEDHGFDVNIGGHHRGSPPGGYFSPYKNPKLKDGPPGESLPQRLGQETANFIEANSERPFFAFLSFYSVHGPIQSNQELWAKYRKKAERIAVPARRFIIDRTSPVRQIQDHPVYAGMIEAMDTGIGLTLKALENKRLIENTIIVFTSDNGGVSAGDGKATSNLPLRGGKGRQWEGGIREPFYIVWPGVVTPGSTCEVPVTGADFYPTLLEMTGLPQEPQQHRDGCSLVPLLKGGTIQSRTLFWHYPHYGNQGGEPSSIIRRGEWKLIHYYEDDRNELYNLSEDPGEQRDVAAKESARARQMSQELDEFLNSLMVKKPQPNPHFDPQLFERQSVQTRKKTLPALEAQAARVLQPSYNPKGWWGSEN